MKRIVIVGAGFAGFYAARRLARSLGKRDSVSITLVSRDNYLLFTPLLHEVASGELRPEDIVSPIRRALRRVHFVNADVEAIDLDERRVRCQADLVPGPFDLEYDQLLLATGSETSFGDLPDLANRVLTLKSLADAVLLRNALIACLEESGLEEDPARRRSLLSPVIVGGGFSGVETTGAIRDFMRDAVRLYRDVDPRDLRVVLVHPGEFLLPELGEKLGRYAERKLRDRGVEIHLRERVTGYEDDLLTTTTGFALRSRLVVWTGGVKPGPMIESLRCEKRKGRIVVNENLEVADRPGVWAVGDCAAVPGRSGELQPPTAQLALREGIHAARNIAASVDGRPQAPFRFQTLGQLAAIGRRAGVANLFGVKFSGILAWFVWRTVYLLKLPTMSERVRVALGWTLDLVFPRDMEQIISVRDIHLVARRRQIWQSRSRRDKDETRKAA
jgi:NADH dehydrogenase